MTTKRLMGWAVSLVLGLATTLILFEFTPIDIPFIEGGAFTWMSVLLAAFTYSYILDSLLNLGLYDERGWHLGLLDPMGPLGEDDAPPPDDYEPIVSREQRLKQQK